MLVQILDAEAQPHTVAWVGQDQINDQSGALGADAVGQAAVFQEVMPANSARAGFLFQNTSQNAMLLMEINETDPPATSSWVIMPGAFFPPYAGYPIPTGVILVQGTIGPVAGIVDQGLIGSVAGDTFSARDWQNATNE